MKTSGHIPWLILFTFTETFLLPTSQLIVSKDLSEPTDFPWKMVRTEEGGIYAFLLGVQQKSD